FCFPPVLFIFNICNIVSLFYPLFANDISMPYKIQKKPDNWQDAGQEMYQTSSFEQQLHDDFLI
ncbi:MAG: hypothetical protein IK023_05440, partial [Bacteroidaceae bacterium]|nr:hypothetical protein [Bacteroidaceae bacterium]